ncbi:MAG: hypothetical protein IID34_07375 [Planctomycetes bacterium]|nr:hypothetical protein [Planctomycetota bacterium]
MTPDAQKKGPLGYQAGEGEGKIVACILPTRRDGRKHDLIWPRDDHPFARQLREDANFVWDRMMASVARPGTVRGEVRELRNEIRDLQRTVAELHVQCATADGDAGPPQQKTARPRIEISRSVRHPRRGGR